MYRYKNEMTGLYRLVGHQYNNQIHISLEECFITCTSLIPFIPLIFPTCISVHLCFPFFPDCKNKLNGYHWLQRLNNIMELDKQNAFQ